jgi:Fur family ferric uptake transcriptional regulator
MLFEINLGDNHHHIVCRQCGAVADVDCAVGTIPCAVPQQTHGFVVEEAEVTYWGLCPDCAQDRGRRSVDDSRAEPTTP